MTHAASVWLRRPPILPRPIAGLTWRALRVFLETRGFRRTLSKRAAGDREELRVVEYMRAGVVFLESMSAAKDRAGRVVYLSAALHAVDDPDPGNDERRDDTAGAVLAAVASLTYSDSEPQRACEWIREHVADAGARVTIGAATFEIDPDTTRPGESYRVTISAEWSTP